MDGCIYGNPVSLPGRKDATVKQQYITYDRLVRSLSRMRPIALGKNGSSCCCCTEWNRGRRSTTAPYMGTCYFQNSFRSLTVKENLNFLSSSQTSVIAAHDISCKNNGWNGRRKKGMWDNGRNYTADNRVELHRVLLGHVEVGKI
jgi:hypothetical protein